jgi:hypothetical protein
MTTPRYDPDQAFEVLLRHVGFLTGQIHGAVAGLLSNLPAGFDPGSPQVALALDILRHPPPTAAKALQQTHTGAQLLVHGWPRSRPRGSVRAAADLAEHFSDAQTSALVSLTLDSLRHWATFNDLPGEVHAGCESVSGTLGEPAHSTTLYRQGQSAFERLIGFHCLMGNVSPDEATSLVTKIARSAIDGAMQGHAPGPPATDIEHGQALAKQYLGVFAAFARRRTAVIDLDSSTADLPEYQRRIDAQVQSIVLATVAADAPDRWRRLWQAMLGMAIEWYAWTEEPVPVRTVSQQPSATPILRRAARVLSMVHELHKAGYQRIRILPYLSPSGGHWRCTITTSDNVADDGYSILDESDARLVARYTTGQDNRYFDWQGSENSSARELAERFLGEFPDIARGGAGRDWMYAGWLTDVLGRAESGRTEDLLYLIADWEIPDGELRRWRPPPPFRDPTAL